MCMYMCCVVSLKLGSQYDVRPLRCIASELAKHKNSIFAQFFALVVGIELAISLGMRLVVVGIELAISLGMRLVVVEIELAISLGMRLVVVGIELSFMCMCVLAVLCVICLSF